MAEPHLMECHILTLAEDVASLWVAYAAPAWGLWWSHEDYTLWNEIGPPFLTILCAGICTTTCELEKEKPLFPSFLSFFPGQPL